MGALEVTLGVWCIESKNVEKALVFEAFLKISCKEFSHLKKKRDLFNMFFFFLQNMGALGVTLGV